MPGVLNRKQRYVFIHVPKCAGTSVSNTLLRSAHATSFRDIPNLMDIVQQENANSFELISDCGHARARDIRKLLGHNIYEALESFTIVRNPWTRLISRYHYLRESKNPNVQEPLDGSFDDFVHWVCDNRPSRMCERLTDAQGKIIVKHVIKLENLEQEFSNLSEILFGERIKLPVFNASSRGLKNDSYSKKSIELVQRVFKADFVLFGYSNLPPAS